VQLSLGVVAVKDDAVQGDADDFDHNLNDDADKRPVLVLVLVPFRGKGGQAWLT
jgi:hypothetical protein